MKILHTFPLALLCAATTAQIAVFPDEYVAVPEGPFNSNTLPLSRGTSRVQCLYDLVDLSIPVGNQITRLGFREDGTTTQIDQGIAMQVEIRMGWSTFDHQSMTTNFDTNYDTPPVTVFGPALYTPPALRDPNTPLPNGQFFINLNTPFDFTPNGRNLVVEYRVFGTANGGAPFTYRVDRADYYSTVSFGPAGCAHSGGNTPNHSVNPTRPGLSWFGNITGGPINQPAFLAINVGNTFSAPYPLGAVFPGISPLCTGQMNLTGTVLLSGITGSSGSESWSFSIPNDNVFGDMHISSQAIFLDFFSPGQVVVSNAADVFTGIRPRTSIIAASGPPTSVVTGSKSTNYCPVAFFDHQ
ncbi:MAG: hypothetical protein ACI8UD_003929 [Planctomycetota bacterium]|jgi:hypothetical protein